MKKTLRKPENWQDFESLCKKLWGEIWECSEIKKNGRSGQIQHGVDVYGVPKNETQYFGIQCKGKDDYSNSQLTKLEIDNEIIKAKLFSPKLKKFYFATTANKDSSIEEYVRIKDVESRESESFEIHLFCWEDIADLIEENKKTFDWYVKNIDHKILYDVLVTFHDDSDHIEFSPKLVKHHKTYKLKGFKDFSSGLHSYSPEDNRKIRMKIVTEPQPVRYYMNGTSYNKSSSVFSIRIKNTGNTAIKSYKLYFKIDGAGVVADTVRDRNKFSYHTWINEGTTKGVFEPTDTILVQKDGIQTDDLCIRPTVEQQQEVKINWKLVSEDFDKNGTLTIKLNTEIIEISSIEEYEYPLEDEVILENYTESH